MAKIKIISECPLYDGMPVTFKAPCDCTAVDGLTVAYGTMSQSFGFRDAHGNDLAGIGNLFAEGAYVKAILNTVNGYAYIQNADTNKYLEDKFGAKADLQSGKVPASQLPAMDYAASSHTHAAGDVTSGTFSTDRIPSLAAGKITSGTFGVARGGTGKASWTANRLIYPSAATTMAQLGFPSVAGSVLRQGTSGAPYWTSLADLKTAMGVGVEMNLLWQNASPLSTFAEQTLNVDSSGYDALLIIATYCADSVNNVICLPPVIVYKDMGTTGSSDQRGMIIGYGSCHRRVKKITDSTINIGSGNGATGQTDNNFIVPYKIFGLRGAS